MIPRIVEFSLTQRLLICTLGVAMLFGGLYAFHLLDVVLGIATRAPNGPVAEVLSQNYKTVPRRFQQWCRGEVLCGMLVDLGNSLREEDTLDELECFIDATVAAL